MNVIKLLNRASLKRSMAVASIALVSTLTTSTGWAQSLSLSDSILPEQAERQGAAGQEEVNNFTPVQTGAAALTARFHSHRKTPIRYHRLAPTCSPVAFVAPWVMA